MNRRIHNRSVRKNGAEPPVTILIVEDDPGLSALIDIALRERGWETTIAATGAEALKEVMEHHPVLLLLDYSLPDMSAVGFIEAAAKARITLPPFIVATGRGDERIAVDMMKRGARDYIVKDSQFLNALGIAVERTLERLETERRLAEAERSLKESEERYRLLLDGISEAVYLHEVSRTEQGRFLAVNDAACRMLGYTQEEFLVMDVSDIDEPEQEQRLPRILKELFMEGSALFKTHHIAKDGRKIPVEISTRLFTYNGKPAVISVVRDISERKRTAKRLKEAEQKFQTLFDAMNEMAILHELVLDPAGNPVDYQILDCNPAFSQITGIPGERAAGALASTLYGSEEPPYLDVYARVVATGDPVHFDSYFESMNKHFSISAFKTGPQHFATVATDITERVSATVELKKNRDFLETILENIPDMIFVKEPHELKFVRFNKAGEELLGYTREELLGKNDFDIFPVEQAQQFVAKDWEVISNGVVVDIPEEVVETRNGPRILHTKKLPILDENGKPSYLLGISEDITDRKITENELRESTSRNQALVRSLPDLIFLLTKDGVFLDYHTNDPMLLFAPPHKFLRHHIREVFASPFREKLEGALTKARHSGEMQTLEYEEQIEGELRYHEARIMKSGEDTIFMMIRDVTDRKKMETVMHNLTETLEERVAERTSQLEETNQQLREARAEAERANKAKSIFLASMSHEIRTPMNAVLGYTQLLRRSEPLTDPQREYLGTILRSGEHLLDLINQVLELSKIEAGRITLNPADLDLHQLLADIRSLFLMQANEKGLDFELRHEGTVPRHINADSGKIRQVLINLVGNAMKFTQKGKIALTVRDTGPTYNGDDHLITIDVTDTGPGMTAEEVSRMFDHFEQTSSGVKSGGGTGLGLAISKQYATLMEGGVSATSTPGTGTTVTFSFRALPAQKAPTVVQSRYVIKRLPPGLIYKVLIVDDNASNRDILRILLSEKGFITHEAVNGREALAAFWKWRPDLIFMDLLMPEMDGKEAIRQIRSTPEGAAVPIIVITASAMEETQREIFALGANGFMRKPFHEEELCTNLIKVLHITCGTEEENMSTPVAETTPATAITKTTPTVPAVLREELHAATLRGDADALHAIADRLSAGETSLATFLHTAVDSFDYEAIMNLLEGDGHE